MYWLHNSSKQFKDPNRKYFLMDTDDDIENLPTRVSKGSEQYAKGNVINEPVEMGSVAYSISSGAKFILNSRNEWKRIKDV